MKREQFQSYGTIAALIISTMALVITIYEANLMRIQQNAMVWPYFTIASNYSGDGFSFVAKNDGTGPAIIESVECRYKDKPVKNFDDLLDQIKPDRTIGYDRLKMNEINKTVLKAGERKVVFNMPWDEETRMIASQMQYVNIRVQYRSVLEDRWLFDSDERVPSKETWQAEVEFGE